MNKLKNFTSLRRLIELRGAIPISTFMEEVLLNHDLGYYAQENAIGHIGDFVTSPEISQLFGEMLGIWCLTCWELMGCPKEFTLVELGPGKGTLMHDLLRSTRNVPGFHQALEIYMVEASNKLSKIQQNKLKSFNYIKQTWHDNIYDLPKKPTLIIANEFFDALPIRQYQKIKDEWYEILISIIPSNQELCFIKNPIEKPINTYLNAEHPNAIHNAIYESSLKSIEYMQNIADHIYNYGGCAAIIDYGYDYEPNQRIDYSNSLQAVKNHKYHPVLSDIGYADISAHVDFNILKKAAEHRKCSVIGAISQNKFLTSLGIDLRAKMLLKNASSLQGKAIMSGLERLISPQQMGDLFKVVAIYNDFSNNQLIF